MVYSTRKEQGYAAIQQDKEKSQYQPQKQYGMQDRQKKSMRSLGCTCGGNSPCRGTCRTLIME